MARVFTLMFLLFVSSLSRAEVPVFAEIPWGLSKEEVRKQLTSKGFSAGALDKDGDFRFDGTLLGYKSSGFALFADSKLSKIIVRMATPDNKAIETFRSMKGVLMNKYGKPSEDFEFFQKPYFDGDGYETQAIRKGKATFSVFWPGGLNLEIHETVSVQVNYESTTWAAEADRRKARAASVF